jgi:hypothetical protein
MAAAGGGLAVNYAMGQSGGAGQPPRPGQPPYVRIQENSADVAF